MPTLSAALLDVDIQGSALDPLGAAPPDPQFQDRLYGRQRGHRLRARQQALLDQALPRIRFPLEHAAKTTTNFKWPIGKLRFEIGFGGGEHAEAIVRAYPGDGLIAAEVFANGICSLLSRLVPEGQEASSALPPNLLLWDGDARTLLRALPDACLDTVFLMFPDPWPKSRHAKRRFVNPANIELLARVIRPGGEWRIASDDPTYQDWVRRVMSAQAPFAGVMEASQRPGDWPATRYETKAEMAERRPAYWSYLRR